jgi:hypothetical protein
MEKRTKMLGFVAVLLVTANFLTTPVAAASDFVGVSDTVPWLSYYYYSVTITDGDNVTKGSVLMSVRNITRGTNSADIYTLFEVDLSGIDPVLLKKFTINYEVPTAVDTESPGFGFGMLLLFGLTISFTNGWIVNKAATQKTLTYQDNNDKISFTWDNNGVLKSAILTIPSSPSTPKYEIKRIIEPLYIYGGLGVVALLILLGAICCIKKKK